MRGSRLVVPLLLLWLSIVVALPTAVSAAEPEADPVAAAITHLRETGAAIEAGRDPEMFADDGAAILDDLAGLDLPPLTLMVLAGRLESSDRDAEVALYESAATLLEDAFAAPAPVAAPVSGSGGSRGGMGVPLWVGLLSMASITVLSLAVGWYRRYSSRLEKLALVDPLTGLANRRRLDQDLAHLEAARRAAREAVSVAMVDVDFFKRFNDAFGHQEGDRALRSVGSTIAAAVRPGDVVYRYGGEEFLVLMTNAPQSEAQDVCEGIRISVAGLNLSLTVSVGVATGIREPLPTLTVAADEALFRAKEEGRNRVVATTIANLAGARVSPL